MTQKPRWCLVLMLVALGCSSEDEGGAGGGLGGANQGGTAGQKGSGATGGSDPCADCAGCCDGSTCLPLASQSELSCGKGGGKCATCSTGQKCSAGACVTDPNVCSPASCPEGCCNVNGTCVTGSTWSACSKGGTTCLQCAYMALCKDKSTCDDDSWGPDAVMDLYIDGISVSEAQCSDPVGAPDPIVSFSVGGQVYVESCNDAYSCTFSPPLKISKVTMSQFLQGKVAFKIEDSDESLDDSCWSGALPAPVARDFGGLVYKPGDGTVTYHLKPTGK